MGNFSKLSKPGSTKSAEGNSHKPNIQLKDNRTEAKVQNEFSKLVNSSVSEDSIQRVENEEEELQMKEMEEEELQMKEKDEEELQMKSKDSGSGPQNPLQIPVQRVENNTGLPDQLKSGVENLSGYSLDDVNVHYNSAKPAQLNAHAYAQGTDIHIGPGQEQHLPHEAWHVVQQKQGRVRPTKQLKGKVNINDDSGLEKEADVMGAKALSINNPLQARLITNNSAMGPIQMVDDEARPVYDEKMTELVEQTIAIITELGQKGNDWKAQYQKKGKQKAREKTGNLLSGKKDNTDYKKEVLKKIWGQLTYREKLSVARAVGGSLFQAVKTAGSAFSEIPFSEMISFGDGNSEREEREERGNRESRSKREAESSDYSESFISKILDEITLEDAENAYDVYKEYGRFNNQIKKAKGEIIDSSGEVGGQIGAFFGDIRDRYEFSEQCESQRRSIFLARKRLSILRPQVSGDSRYNDEINALDDALFKFHGPTKVFGDLDANWDKDYAEVCDIALENLKLAKISRSGILGGFKNLGRLVRIIPESESTGNQQMVPNLEKPDSLESAQAGLVSKLKQVTNKSWGAKTFFFFTPSGISKIKTELNKDKSPSEILAKIKVLVATFKSFESSTNRSDETQILYDALANINVNNLNSVWAAISKVDDVDRLI